MARDLLFLPIERRLHVNYLYGVRQARDDGANRGFIEGLLLGCLLGGLVGLAFAAAWLP
jgi:hypothetical protein